MTKFTTIKQSFQMQYEYQLHFTERLFSQENRLLLNILQKHSINSNKVLVVLDDGVAKAHQDLVSYIREYFNRFKEQLQLKELLLVNGGEQAKVDENSLERVLKAINDNHICRHSIVLAIGGGAVIDMVGYAAGTAHRGVKLIRIPTTVLAQNDAAVGVKNGINFFGKKNFLGSFAPPSAIINDLEFLKSLEQRDWISGIAEAVKVAAIKDDNFFTFLEANATKMANREMESTAKMIHRCAELHMQHIAQGGDPFESGSSRPLDFGHWAAHKLEQMTNYRLRHGEAVAIGIALDLTYANLIGLLDDNALKRVLNLLENIGFDLKIPMNTDDEVEELLKGIEEFREHLGGQLTITLISGIGKKHDVHEIDFDVMRKAINSRKASKVVSL